MKTCGTCYGFRSIREEAQNPIRNSPAPQEAVVPSALQAGNHWPGIICCVDMMEGG